MRNLKGWTQQELGEKADINYKFLGEIERGQKNVSFKIIVKIATALEVDLPELFRFEQEITDRKETERRIQEIIKSLPDDALGQLLSVLRTMFPVR